MGDRDLLIGKLSKKIVRIILRARSAILCHHLTYGDSVGLSDGDKVLVIGKLIKENVRSFALYVIQKSCHMEMMNLRRQCRRKCRRSGWLNRNTRSNSPKHRRISTRLFSWSQ